MILSNSKKTILLIISLIGLALIALFYIAQRYMSAINRSDHRGLYNPPPIPKINLQTTQADVQPEKPLILTTNPSPLEDVTILPNQIIELTFKYSLIAPSELKHKIDPPADIKIELSENKKTARIIPVKPYKLGNGYTLFIQPDTKFEGGKILKEELIYHFKTIGYRGI